MESTEEQKVASHIQTLFRQGENNVDIIENIRLEELLHEENITQQDVYKALKELKIRKAPGPMILLRKY